MNENRVKDVVIAGGGTAGWITAAVLAKTMGKTLNIMLVESDAIPTIGVGEATIPPIRQLHEMLELDEKVFMAASQGTFKLGIAFEGWKAIGEDYIHSFGLAGTDNWVCKFVNYWLAGRNRGIEVAYGDYCAEHLAARQGKFAKLPRTGLNYAYHLDAGRYAGLLREFSEKRGVTRIEGKIEQVKTRSSDGFIESLQLADGQQVVGDLFIDCTGFRGLLIGGALNTEFQDWTHWLPCDRALAVQTETVHDPIPYTRSIAHTSGWQWRIPLQHRVGNGLVYCSQHLGDDDAHELLLNNLEGKTLIQPRPIRFTTGTRAKHWVKNCIAVGLSSGFLEPLESTSIHLIQRSVTKLVQFFPVSGIRQIDIDEFNRQTLKEIELVRDFIILHYHVTERDDSEFWRYCRNMSIPDSLAHKIELFRDTARVFKMDGELFGEESWIQVMMGQGLIPKSYHPVADEMSEPELYDFLKTQRDRVKRELAQLPNHIDFINYYCKSM